MLTATWMGFLTDGYRYERNRGFPLDWVAGGMVLPSAEMGGEMGGIRQPATASPIIKNKISKWQLSYQSRDRLSQTNTYTSGVWVLGIIFFNSPVALTFFKIKKKKGRRRQWPATLFSTPHSLSKQILLLLPMTYCFSFCPCLPVITANMLKSDSNHLSH